jgi:hypothetical protein
MRFASDDGGMSAFYVVDGNKHIYRVPCQHCGETPKLAYSTDNPERMTDGYEQVLLRCACSWIQVGTGAAIFDRARGAMISAAGSWWNAAQDLEGHPDDLGTVGGFVVDAEDVDRRIKENDDREEREGKANGSASEKA